MIRNYSKILNYVNISFLFLGIIIVYFSSNLMIMGTEEGFDHQIKNHFLEFIIVRFVFNILVIAIFSLLTLIISYLIIKVFGTGAKRVFKNSFLFMFLVLQIFSIMFIIIVVSY